MLKPLETVMSVIVPDLGVRNTQVVRVFVAFDHGFCLKMGDALPQKMAGISW
jgi:hypothetical protein